MDMLEAAEDIDTMLQIEMRISDVTAEVESMEAQLRSYDNRCNFATIYLSVEEVRVYTPTETKELTKENEAALKDVLKTFIEKYMADKN